jgi:hypothetical protein
MNVRVRTLESAALQKTWAGQFAFFLSASARPDAEIYYCSSGSTSTSAGYRMPNRPSVRRSSNTLKEDDRKKVFWTWRTCFAPTCRGFR